MTDLTSKVEAVLWLVRFSLRVVPDLGRRALRRVQEPDSQYGFDLEDVVARGLPPGKTYPSSERQFAPVPVGAVEKQLTAYSTHRTPAQRGADG